METYTLEAVEDLVQRYVNELGGELTEIHEGTLGYGQIVLH